MKGEVFTDGKLRMLFFPLKEIEQTIFEDDLKDNVMLELKFKNLDSVKLTSDDCNEHYKRTYSQEIYKVLKLIQGWRKVTQEKISGETSH